MLKPEINIKNYLEAVRIKDAMLAKMTKEEQDNTSRNQLEAWAEFFIHQYGNGELAEKKLWEFMEKKKEAEKDEITRLFHR